MAFAFDIQPTVVGFNLDRPEEVILIHHFEMAESVTPDDQILVDFGRKFFEEGKGVSEIDFDHIIELAKSVSEACKGLPVKPSGLTDYMQTHDKAKSDIRKQIRGKLAQRGGSQMLADAYEQLEKLPTPMADDARHQKILFDLYRANSRDREEAKKSRGVRTDNLNGAPNRPNCTEADEQPDMAGISTRGQEPNHGRSVSANAPKTPSNSEVLRVVQGDIASMHSLIEGLCKQVEALTQEIQELKLERSV